jgi:hypothetical protein
MHSCLLIEATLAVSAASTACLSIAIVSILSVIFNGSELCGSTTCMRIRGVPSLGDRFCERNLLHKSGGSNSTNTGQVARLIASDASQTSPTGKSVAQTPKEIPHHDIGVFSPEMRVKNEAGH